MPVLAFSPNEPIPSLFTHPFRPCDMHTGRCLKPGRCHVPWDKKPSRALGLGALCALCALDPTHQTGPPGVGPPPATTAIPASRKVGTRCTSHGLTRYAYNTRSTHSISILYLTLTVNLNLSLSLSLCRSQSPSLSRSLGLSLSLSLLTTFAWFLR